MGLMNFFKRLHKEATVIEERENTAVEKREATTLEEILLQAGIPQSEVTRENVMNIPAVAGCVNLITNTIAMIPINLYRRENGAAIKIDDDTRVSLLNIDTGDTLNGVQFKKALIKDYLLDGVGYAYLNKQRNNLQSIHYVKKQNVNINMNSDPIFKKYDIIVNGKTYRDFEFIKVTRDTEDGARGTGIIKEHNELLQIGYNLIRFENVLLNTGGNKKGFIKSENKLDRNAIDELKKAWKNLYANNTENVVVLNKGLDFQEASNTSVEMQLNEKLKTNNDSICEILNVPPPMLGENVSDEIYNNYIKICIMPILTALISALNKDMLLESEKDTFFFGCDIKELLKGDILKRYQAYEIALTAGIMQVDEVRKDENLPPFDLDFIKLGLQDVLYFPKTKQVYTPNTNKLGVMGESSTINIDDTSRTKNKEMVV